MESTNYIPGICNINTAEIAYRRKAMIISYFIAGLIFAIVMVAGWRVWARALLVFLPLYIGVINNLQVHNKFCVSYAATGRQNATDGDTSASDIEDEVSKRTDKQKARTMNLQALAITVSVLALSLFIPAL